MISVVIPARNEVYLQKTIQSALEAAEGDVEVIAVCDGYWPDPPIQDDPRVNLIHHTEAVGQRHAINEAAMLAKGKYILKTDGHSMFDQGYDVKLAADCEKDWTVIPRMYNLDVEKWAPKRKKVTDYMFIRSPKAEKKPWRHYYFDGPCKRENPDEYKSHRKWAKQQPDIADVMTGQGACFFMYKDRFWELGGMDEGHGQWGQMGIEVALKAWLSGGRLVVNKKTWFSHWFRGGGGPGFPYPMKGSEQDKARKYSQDLWLNGKWPLQKKPISWLVDKFAPVPTWNGEAQVAEKVWYKYKDTRDPKPWTQAYALLQCKNPIEKVEVATIPSLRLTDDPWFVKARPFNVKNLHENRLRFANDIKADGIRWQIEVIPPFIKRILANETFDDKKLKALGYYEYLISRLNPMVNPPAGPTPKGVRHVLRKMRDMIRLAYSVRDHGLQSPIDMFLDGPIREENGKKKDRVVLCRGGRRIPILYELGHKKVWARVWRSKHVSRTFIPTNAWPSEDSTITKIAAAQFVQFGSKGTDKYWKHGYTYYYDHMFSELKHMSTLRILELGVHKGASLKLWADAFPQAEVYGIDEKDRMMPQMKHKRIKVFQGNEKDVKFVQSIAKKYGPFHIIIDDCDHMPNSQRIAFDILWPHVCSNKNRGGFYVIEDFHHNFQAKWKDNNMIDTMKGMMDKIYRGNEVKDMAFYPNICFIRKA